MKDKLVVSLLLVAVLVAVVVVIVTMRNRPVPAPVGPPKPAEVGQTERPQVELPPPVRHVEAPAPEPMPATAPEVVEATSEVPGSTAEAALDPLEQLRLIDTNYYYDSFTQIDQKKIGKMMSHVTRRVVTVNEGDELEPGSGVIVESLDPEKAVVRLGDVTDVMICVGHPRFDFLKEWQKLAQKPTDKQRKLAFEHYMAVYGNRANARAIAAGRPPAKEWHPKTKEELKKEMEHYLETTAKEAAERQGTQTRPGVPNPRDLTPEQIAANKAAYRKAMGIPPDAPDPWRDEEKWEPRTKKLGLPESK